MAKDRSESKLRSVEIRRVGFYMLLFIVLKRQHDCSSPWVGILVSYTIRFTKAKSIADIIKSRYGETFVRKIHKFEINDYRLPKGHPNIRFLFECKKNNLILKFLELKLANRHLHNFIVYKKYQIKLLE